MTNTQDALGDTIAEYTAASEALTALMRQAASQLLTEVQTRPVVEREQKAREAYAKELQAAGHNVPFGLV